MEFSIKVDPGSLMDSNCNVSLSNNFQFISITLKSPIMDFYKDKELTQVVSSQTSPFAQLV